MKKLIEEITWESEKINKSRFIGSVSPVYTIEQAMTFLEKIRKRYKDANHHCYAFVLSDGSSRSSDDGEPMGSAGLPILKRLQYLEIVDGIVVVTRYFGGKKLGVGGLVRAYGNVAGEVLRLCRTEEVISTKKLVITYAYSETRAVQMVLAQHNIDVCRSDYGFDIVQQLEVPSDLENDICESLREQTNGRIRWTTSTEF